VLAILGEDPVGLLFACFRRLGRAGGCGLLFALGFLAGLLLTRFVRRLLLRLLLGGGLHSDLVQPFHLELLQQLRSHLRVRREFLGMLGVVVEVFLRRCVAHRLPLFIG
jgi:hypothetical protein